MITEKDVLDALARVPGPDGRKMLPESGAIAGLTIRDGKVYLAIAIDPKRSMEMETMRVDAERAIGKLRDAKGVAVTLTSQQGTSAAPTQSAPRQKAGFESISNIRFIVAVASGKGGVGKSTTAANLALALAAEGWKIGLLDADIFGPSAPRLMGVTGKPEVEGRVMKPMIAHGIEMMSIGFLVEEGTAMIWRGPMVMSAITQMLRDVSWGTLDCLIVDMPPGTGDAQLTMAQSVPMAGAVIVSTPQDLALIDARRGIAMFERTEVPVLGIIENMSYFLCPHCGGRTDVFAHGGARHEAQTLDVPFLGEVPLDIAIRQTSDGGMPIVVSDPASAHAQTYRGIARALRDRLEGVKPRAAPRIVVE